MATPLPKRTTSLPTWNPVTLEMAKQQLQLPAESVAWDDQLVRLIRAAQQTIEDEQDRIGQLGTFEWKLDAFPVLCPIRLPYRNTVEPVSVAYNDSNGDAQSFTDFTFKGDAVYPVLVPNATTWPTAQVGYANSVTINFDAGYSAACDVPEDFQQAILAIVQSLWSGCDQENFGPAYQALAARQVATYL